MILVVASAVDDEAVGLAARCSAEVVVLTPLDLSCAGWAAEIGGAGSTFAAGGTIHAAEEIDGVITRLPAVPAHEMLVLTEKDREYASCEATAFLAWWLSTLTCPVINRPTPVSLVGRARHPWEWRVAAERLGIPTHSALWDTSQQAALDTVTWCTVLDGTATSACDERVARMANEMAGTVEQRLCGFAFTDVEQQLCAATLRPPLDDQVLLRLEEVFA